MKNLLVKLVYVMAILLLVFTTGCDSEGLPTTPPEETTAVATPIGQENILVVGSEDSMINQPKWAPAFTLTEPWKVTVIITVHWNEGKGAEPGLISLKDDNGKEYGPWQAVGKVFKEVENVRWVVEPNLTLPPGKYKVQDSDPTTWSNNELSEYVGFVRVAGIRGGELAGEQPGAQADVQPDQPVLP